MCSPPVVADPTFGTVAGTYNNSFSLSLSCATSGATIHYTTDGSTPTVGSPVYSSPLNITATTTVKAMAEKASYTNSGVATAVYTLLCATPTFGTGSAPYTGSTYAAPLTVTVSCATTGVTLRYTTDGSTPNGTSAILSGSLSLQADTTVKVIALKTGFTTSGVASQAYAVNRPPTCSLTTSIDHRTVTATPVASDPDGTISTLVITWGDGSPQTSGCVSGQGYTHTYPSTGGTFTIQATATDNEGLAQPATPANVVIAAKIPPICSLTDVTINRRTVTITPLVSEGDGVSFTDLCIYWEGRTDGPVTSHCGPGLPSSHTYAATGGTFNVFARVTDCEGTMTDSAITQVVIAPNQSPTCAFTTRVDADHRTLHINASSSSDDTAIVSWRYLPGNGAGWRAGVLGQEASYTYPTHGRYWLTVEVTDSEGASAQHQAEIIVENEAPTCTLYARPEAGCQLSVLALADDADGAVTNLQLDWGDGTTTTGYASGDPLAHAYAVPGDYTLRFTAVDDDGATRLLTLPVSVSDRLMAGLNLQPWLGQSPGAVWEEYRGGSA